MNVAERMVKLAAVGGVLKAAQVLEFYGVLPDGISSNDIVKQYVNANPKINEVLAKLNEVTPSE